MKKLLLSLAFLASYWGALSETRGDDEKPVSELEALAAKARNRSYAPSARIDALSKIGAMGEKARPVTRVLCTVMLSRTPKVRAEAGAALQKVFPELYPHVNTLLTDRDYLHHFAALRGLNGLHDKAKDALPVVLNHLQVNAAAVMRLPDLNSDLLATDFDLQFAIPIVEALVEADEKGRVAVLTERAKQSKVLLTATGQACLLAAADCIVAARIGGEKASAAQAVAKIALKHPNNLVRFAGVASLQLFGKAAHNCLPMLKRVMSTDSDKAVRELAAKTVRIQEAKKE